MMPIFPLATGLATNKICC